ncbi:MAG: hypothetical protein C0469_02055 [Cyanobacteria bacterium DS2.3.42]|nr:hypothetical protein [Cyanobacteria bacterium DS2.3.42]
MISVKTNTFESVLRESSSAINKSSSETKQFFWMAEQVFSDSKVSNWLLYTAVMRSCVALLKGD